MNIQVLNADSTPSILAPLIKALQQDAVHPHGIKLVETHISWVLLTGDYAYKIKKPVNFGFLDFSTLAKREFYCREELRLNRRFAPEWYLDVLPITGSYSQPQMNGFGEPIEYAVRMRQFPSTQTLKDLAGQGQLSDALIDRIADKVAEFHNHSKHADNKTPYGDHRDIRHWIEENFQQLRPHLTDRSLVDQLNRLEAWSRQEWTDKAQLMTLRKTQGFIRECHGDLHLDNIILVKDDVILFDCIEFNPKLYWIDVINDIAFLVMDLMHLGHNVYAYRLLNRYLEKTGDYKGLALLRYYFVYRALVRAKINVLRTCQLDQPILSEHISTDYRVLTGLAELFIVKPCATLIITHGFSGSGKSTYTAQLTEKIKAIHLRSDVERKRLFDLTAEAVTASPLDGGLYSPQVGQMVYRRLAELAHSILAAGFTVIVDATFLKVDQRTLFFKLATDCQAKFLIIDFYADESVLCERIKQRRQDPSEATVEVLHRQQTSAEAFTKTELPYVIRVDTEDDQALDKLLSRL
jgi:aminoglycoside phosphotransferase family enzyme/predicted kinase